MSKLVASNISQALFNENEKLVGSVDKKQQQFSFLGNINPIYADDYDMKSQIPAFLEQSRMSTYYQDNPWKILTYSKKYDEGIPIMGGSINPTQNPGYKPGNTYENSLKGVEHFGNDNAPCSYNMYYLGVFIILLVVLYYFYSKN